jgi:cell division septation protein DedD
MSYNLGRIDPDDRPGLYAVPPEDEPPARPRRVLAIGAALLVMGLFAGGLWLAYVAGLRHAGASASSSDIPLIRADTRPMKVKPLNPGGMAIPDRNMLIYDEGQPAVEHLLPPPEQPMARPSPPVPPSIVAAAAGATAAPTPVREGPGQTAATPADTAPANPRPTAPAPAVAETAPPGTAPVRLQLGSVRSEAAAREEWDRLRRDNPDLLGNLSAIAVRADLGDKGVYFRIETDPVANAARADRICGELRQRHFSCMIIR